MLLMLPPLFCLFWDIACNQSIARVFLLSALLRATHFVDLPRSCEHTPLPFSLPHEKKKKVYVLTTGFFVSELVLVIGLLYTARPFNRAGKQSVERNEYTRLMEAQQRQVRQRNGWW